MFFLTETQRLQGRAQASNPSTLTPQPSTHQSAYRRQAQHAPSSLERDRSRHFRIPFPALGEDDGNFFDRVALFPRRVVQLDLEGVAFGLDFIPIEIAEPKKPFFDFLPSRKLDF
jgi:hypothetical protein